jgi:outer membrane protein assembly factor BamB
MQTIKALAAICGSLVLGMLASTMVPGCTPAAPPPAAPPPAAANPSAGSLTTDDAPAAVEAAPVEAVPVEGAAPVEGKAPETSTPAESPPPAGEKSAASAQGAQSNGTVPAGDWTQWGGSPIRNNTPTATGIVTEWAPGEFDRKTGAWKSDAAKNIRWVTQLGSQTYGNAVVASGRVFVGTNNSAGYLKRYPADYDLGVFVCIDEKTGKFLWQHSSEKLPTGRVHDWPLMGICCSPLVEGERLWFVTSRGEVKCLDVAGFYDGEDDGPVKGETGRLFDLRRADDPAEDKVGGYVKELDEGKLPADVRASFATAGMPLPEGEIAIAADDTTKAPLKKWKFQAKVNGADRDLYLELRGPALSGFKTITPDDKDEADVIWSYNMMEKLGTSQHNMCSCSVTAWGDILFVNTSNGVDDSHLVISAPDAPSFIAMDKNTGEVFWTDNSPGKNILHGQWSSPAVATIGGVDQVLFGGGDGWLYSFKADKGKDGKPELLWKFDANPKDAILELGGRGTRNDIISTPVVYDNKVYFCTGQDPEHGEGDGILYCLDPARRGDISEMLAVNRADPKTPIPVKRIQAVVEADGDMAVPNPNSGIVWKYASHDANNDGTLDFEEQFHRSIGTCVIKNDILFIADFSGICHCLNAKTGKINWTYDMLAASWGSGLIVGDKIYIGDEDGDISVFNLSADPKKAMREIKDEDGQSKLYPINVRETDPGRWDVVNMGNAVYSTPIVANGVLFISNNDHIFAIAPPEGEATTGGE